MHEDLQLIFEEVKEGMEKAVAHFISEVNKLRIGRASASMLDSVTVDYYGSRTPLNNLATVQAPDAQTIVIQPWDRSTIALIEKAILEANLGFNPQNDGQVIKIYLPPPTEERRRQMIKLVHREGEQARIAIRHHRHDGLEALRKMKKEGWPEDELKRAEQEVEKLTRTYIEKIDGLIKKKEEDILSI